MTVGLWRAVGREHRLLLACGFELAIYRDPGEQSPWLWRVTGCESAKARRTGTKDVREAKRVAMRAFALLLHRANNENSAAILDNGT